MRPDRKTEEAIGRVIDAAYDLGRVAAATAALPLLTDISTLDVCHAAYKQKLRDAEADLRNAIRANITPA